MYQWGQSFFYICVSVWCINGDSFFCYVCQCDVSVGTIILRSNHFSFHILALRQDEDPSHAWLYLHENDIVSILQQLPLDAIFAHLLQAPMDESGEGKN